MGKKIILIICIMPILSWANVSGDWNGFGTWTYEGSGAHCDLMTMNFL